MFILALASRRTTELTPLEDVTPVPPYAVPTVVPCHVPDAIVPNALVLPLASIHTAFSDGYVTNTLTVPEKVTAAPALLDDRIVVLVKVPPVAYVPMPASQFPETSVAA